MCVFFCLLECVFVTHLCGQWHSQEESYYSDSQCDIGLIFDNPVSSNLIYYSRHQSLQQTELQQWTEKKNY